jgi:hypothetical protein
MVAMNREWSQNTVLFHVDSREPAERIVKAERGIDLIVEVRGYRLYSEEG